MEGRIERLKKTSMRAMALSRRESRTVDDVQVLDLWTQAFNEYNEVHDKELSMGCYPCYRKVIQWLEGKEPK